MPDPINVERVGFVVDDRPVGVWGPEPRKWCLEFLDFLDPQYFQFLAESHSRLAEGDDAHRSALDLRLAHGHALETLFAFLGALTQAPHCVHGWLYEYQLFELKSLTSKISDSCEFLAFGAATRARQSAYYRLLTRSTRPSLAFYHFYTGETMTDEMARLLSPPSNFAVVQLPGRHYPGVVFQGDSLFTLREAARQVLEQAEHSEQKDLRDSAAEVYEVLDGALQTYESVLRSHGLSLPYQQSR